MPCIDPTTFRKLQGASLEAGIYTLGKAKTLKELWVTISHLLMFFNPKGLYDFFLQPSGKKKRKLLMKKGMEKKLMCM